MTPAVLHARVVPSNVTGHLFVARTARPYAILRFPLNDGLPASTPDFSYPGQFNTIAVGLDGTVYGVQGSNNQIVVFAPGKAKPVRRIDFPNAISGCNGSYYGPAVIGALAVNRFGDLFVAYTTYYSGLRTNVTRVGRVASVGYPCLGVVAFGPTANGHSLPKAAIPLSGQYLLGVTVDSDDRLYVANSYYNKVEEFIDPANHPKAVGYVTIDMNYPDALKTSYSESLYELDGGLLTKNGVNVYPPGAGKGNGPSSTVVFENAYNWVEDIAVRGKYLYASDINYHSSDSVDVYDASANGPTAPIFSLPLKDIWYIATGP